ncbi:MAG TPA: adenosylcobinamide amidohydrolase [Polyangia bacterium]|jgi:adenosylcobinamide amidohydrolase|nr:adenosylcobinamide amidohydrolase [Polyangia bacterium]
MNWPLLEDEGRLLVVRFDRPQRTLSSAIVGGGFGRANAVAWRYVRNADLPHDVDPTALLERALASAGLGDAVGMLTARDLTRFECVTEESGGFAARAVATVGLSNAVAAGDPPGPLAIGTINVLLQLSQPLTDGAFVEALALAAEARTAAVMEARVLSRRSCRWATGTGTDCLVVAAPVAVDEAAVAYVGKHTIAGSLAGAAVYEAVRRGVHQWIAEQQAPSPSSSGDENPQSRAH